MKPFYLYILKCSDNSYYVGHTDDLEKRLAEHNLPTSEHYTSLRLPVTLAHTQEFMTRAEAIDAEQQIKKWTRRKKEALIKGEWNNLKTLSKKKFKK